MGDLDDQRWKRQVQEYLQQLDATKRYVEEVLDTALPDLVDFQNSLCNGVSLALLSCALTGNKKEFPPKNVYDPLQNMFRTNGLQYRHIDNIRVFLKYLNHIKLPVVFHPDAADIFERKNIPKLVYCIRAIMNHLNSTVKVKKQEFSDDVVAYMANELENCDLPHHQQIFSPRKCTSTKSPKRKSPRKPAKEKPVIRQNIAATLDSIISRGSFVEFCKCAEELFAVLDINTSKRVFEGNTLYFHELINAKSRKGASLDAEELKAILQNQIQVFYVSFYTLKCDTRKLLKVLSDAEFVFDVIYPENIAYYYHSLKVAIETKIAAQVFNSHLTQEKIQDIVSVANDVYVYNLQNNAAKIIQRWWMRIANRIKVEQCRRKQAFLQKIITIQAVWRGALVRVNLRKLKTNPTFPVIKKFSAVLQNSITSYEKELVLQNLRSELVREILLGKTMMKQIEEKDLQIGLLIQNRLEVNDMVAHQKKTDGELNLDHQKLKALKPENQAALEAYQHLFYSLQIHPEYLSVLIANMSPNDRLLQDVILHLFNYGATRREEYYLLKLLETVVRNDVTNVFDNVKKIVAAQSMGIKMFVAYGKQMVKVKQFSQILENPIASILEDQTDFILSPLEIYNKIGSCIEKQRFRDLMTPTNDKDAIKIDLIRKTLENSVSSLKLHLRHFLDCFRECYKVLPYGIRYIYKVILRNLMDKFKVSRESLVKCIGHSLFNHFINPVIISPELYGIVELSVEKPILPRQRKNLAVMAKLLQNIIIEAGFSNSCDYLREFEEFALGKSKEFFKAIDLSLECKDLEHEFGISPYSEAMIVHHPHIVVTLEILAKLILTLKVNETALNSVSDGLLQEALDEVHPFLTADDLLETDLFKALGVATAKQQFRVACINKYSANIKDNFQVQKLFVSTKELCVSLLPYLSGTTLRQALHVQADKDVTAKYEENMRSVRSRCERLNLEPFRTDLTLYQSQCQLKKMLDKLELQSYTSKSDGYQTVFKAIAQDVLQQGHFRRLQDSELCRLRKSRQSAKQQNSKLEEQLAAYESYIINCLENQVAGRKTLHGRPAGKLQCELKMRKSIKYTAQKLLNKEVLVSIANVPESYFPNITIEIIPQENPGYFLITGKLNSIKSINIEQCSLDIRHLLHLQYQGIEAMEILQDAKINVNAFILLINRKFYGVSDSTFKFL